MRALGLSFAALTTALLAAPLPAHMLANVGSLVDLVGRSDRIVAGRPSAPVAGKTVVVAEAVLLGGRESDPIEFSGPARFESGKRQVFFLRRTGSGVECLQQRGAIYPAEAADDRLYRQLIERLRRAQSLAEDNRIPEIRQALISALESPLPALRYHATLDLLATVHSDHPFTPSERAQLQALIAKPVFDPQLRELLTARLAGAKTR